MRWSLLSLLLTVCSMTACTSLPDVSSVMVDGSYQAQLPPARIASRRVFLAPLIISYQATPFDGAPKTDLAVSKEAVDSADTESEQEATSNSLIARYQVPLTSAEQINFQKSLLETMSLVFEKDNLGILPAASTSRVNSATEFAVFRQRAEWCRAAEDRGGQILATAQLVENSVTFKGQESSGWTMDLLVTLLFFPLNIYVHDEVFDVRQTLKISYYDVRDPVRPIHQATISGEKEWVCDELDHGYIFLNAFSSGDNHERFEETNWRKVYELLEPHTNRKLEEALVADCQSGIGESLKNPAVIKRLDEGDASTARLYVVALGQNLGNTKFAVRDAEDVYRYCQEKGGVSPAHSFLASGKSVTEKDVLKTIRSFQTKKVDRFLFFFAGQGRQSLEGQDLLLTNGKSLSLSKLASAVASLNVGASAFILDCSFGDPERGAVHFGRTATDSLPSLGSKSADFLSALRTESNWRVLCAAPSNSTAPEIRDNGHGLLTWLLLKKLNGLDRSPTLDAIQEGLSERYAKICQSLTGEPTKPFSNVEPRAKDFLLGRTRVRHSSKASKTASRSES